MRISSQWWEQHGMLPGKSTDLKHDPILNPRQIKVEIWREDELARRRGLKL
jgi:hypothetical protein